MCREEFYLNQAEEAGYSLAPGRGPEGEIKVFTCQYSSLYPVCFAWNIPWWILTRKKRQGFRKGILKASNLNLVSHIGSLSWGHELHWLRLFLTLVTPEQCCVRYQGGVHAWSYVGLWLNNDLDRGVFLFIPVAQHDPSRFGFIEAVLALQCRYQKITSPLAWMSLDAPEELRKKVDKDCGWNNLGLAGFREVVSTVWVLGPQPHDLQHAHLPAAQEEAHRACGRSCVAGTGGTVGATMDGCITAALDRSVEHGVWPPPRTLTPWIRPPEENTRPWPSSRFRVGFGSAVQMLCWNVGLSGLASLVVVVRWWSLHLHFQFSDFLLHFRLYSLLL